MTKVEKNTQVVAHMMLVRPPKNADAMFVKKERSRPCQHRA